MDNNYKQTIELVQKLFEDKRMQESVDQTPDLEKTEQAYQYLLNENMKLMQEVVDTRKEAALWQSAYDTAMGVREQQEPVAWLDEEKKIIYWHNTHATDDYHGFRRTTPLYTRPQARELLSDEQIVWLVPGLLDCLCDPYDCDKSGNQYASIPKDMVRLARAIEKHHGIKDQ